MGVKNDNVMNMRIYVLWDPLPHCIPSFTNHGSRTAYRHLCGVASAVLCISTNRLSSSACFSASLSHFMLVLLRECVVRCAVCSGVK